MKIHTVKEGEALAEIAELYEISEERIRENNCIGEKVCRGHELLIQRPTRTYRAGINDTVLGIARRFGTTVPELEMRNPSIRGDAAIAGREIAVKYNEVSGGAIGALGYFYPSTSVSRLRTLMPYLTYLCISAYRLDSESLIRLFDTREIARLGRESAKVTLMRVFDGSDGKMYCDSEKRKRLADSLVTAAKSGHFHGIMLSAFGAARSNASAFTEFLIELRRAMIGCDLILFTECDETAPHDVAELADGAVFSYSKISRDPSLSFNDGERKAFTDFSDGAESSKVMIDLPALAVGNGRCIGLSELLSSDMLGEITTDKEALVSRTDRGESFESLGNIKARLGLVDELGFMGIAFDIGRVPIEHIMMAYAIFAPVHLQAPFSLPM